MLDENLRGILRRLYGRAKMSAQCRATVTLKEVNMIRGALGLDPDEAQVVDTETVLTVPEGTVLWEEMQMSEGGPSRVVPVMKDAAGRLGDLDAYMKPADIASAGLPDEVGSRIRWWDRRPSDERRAMTPWESE